MTAAAAASASPASIVVDWAIRVVVPLVIGAVGYLGTQIVAHEVALEAIERTMVTHQDMFEEFHQHGKKVHEGAVTRGELDVILDKQWIRFSERQDLLFQQMKDELALLREEVKDLKKNSK